MNETKKMTKICPLPWIHFSSHLDSSMRICCNTDTSGFILNDQNETIKLNDVSDIDAYFNLTQYKDIRKKMLNGEEPEICRKCYQVEHNGGLSVRQAYMNHYEKNETFHETLKKTQPDGTIKAKVQSLDFSLSNKCNLKCIMCSPDASYIIKQDYDKLNIDYSIEFTNGAHKNWENLPNLDKIIPQIAPYLEEFLTTGGEPFLNKQHERILELIIESGHAHKVSLSYHTNCTVSNKKLFELWHSFKHINLHFSIDAHGELDNYIRKNTNFETVKKNVEIMINHPKTICEVHSTIQALNIFNLIDLYEWIASLKDIPSLPFHIWMDQPSWLKMHILPKPLLLIAYKRLENYFSSKKEDGIFLEENKVNQILSYIKRAIQEPQDLEGLELFKTRLKDFEKIRSLGPIENIVPEFKLIFNQ